MGWFVWLGAPAELPFCLYAAQTRHPRTVSTRLLNYALGGGLCFLRVRAQGEKEELREKRRGACVFVFPRAIYTYTLVRLSSYVYAPESESGVLRACVLGVRTLRRVYPHTAHTRTPPPSHTHRHIHTERHTHKNTYTHTQEHTYTQRSLLFPSRSFLLLTHTHTYTLFFTGGTPHTPLHTHPPHPATWTGV